MSNNLVMRMSRPAVNRPVQRPAVNRHVQRPAVNRPVQRPGSMLGKFYNNSNGISDGISDVTKDCGCGK